jgi:CheY-like chemotaxis protein
VLQEKPDLILLDIFFPPDAARAWQHLGCVSDYALAPTHGRTPMPETSPYSSFPGLNRRNSGIVVWPPAQADYFQKPIKIPELLNAIQQVSLGPMRERCAA